MARPLIPTRGVFVSSAVIFHPTMSPQARDTLIQLQALAWGKPVTPPFTLDQLIQITGKSKRTLYGHIAELRDSHAALRLQPAGGGSPGAHKVGAGLSKGGTYIVVFAEWTRCRYGEAAATHDPPEVVDGPPGVTRHARRIRRSSLCKKLHTLNEEEESRDLNDSGNQILLLKSVESLEKESEGKPKKMQKFAKLKKSAKKCPEPSAPDPGRLPEELKQRLLSSGIFPSLLDEIAASAYSADDLSALLAWVEETEAKMSKPALFILRLRAGAIPPEKYYADPCPSCGQRGSHAASCTRRYIDGEFGEFIKH